MGADAASFGHGDGGADAYGNAPPLGKRKRKHLDVSEFVDDEGADDGMDTDGGEGFYEGGGGGAAGAAAANAMDDPHTKKRCALCKCAAPCCHSVRSTCDQDRTCAFAAAVYMHGVRRCARGCRGIKPLLEYPVDAKKLHGRACYCHPCKRLRCRAQNISKDFNVEWLRAALQSGELRARLGAHADAVLTVHQPDKPVTHCMSDDAHLAWEGDVVSGAKRSAVALKGAATRRERAARAAAAAAADDGGYDSDDGGEWAPFGSTALLGSLPPDGGPRNGAQEDNLHVAQGGGGEETLAALMTRRILLEHREFARMYLAVRERLATPGLSDEQLALEEQTAAELEVHLQELRGDIARSFVSG